LAKNTGAKKAAKKHAQMLLEEHKRGLSCPRPKGDRQDYLVTLRRAQPPVGNCAVYWTSGAAMSHEPVLEATV